MTNKQRVEKIIKYAFILSSIVAGANCMYLSGMLMGQYGTDHARGLFFAFVPISIFWLGRWSYKYKDLNPL